jgi:hypothetical protein
LFIEGLDSWWTVFMVDKTSMNKDAALAKTKIRIRIPPVTLPTGMKYKPHTLSTFARVPTFNFQTGEIVSTGPAQLEDRDDFFVEVADTWSVLGNRSFARTASVENNFTGATSPAPLRDEGENTDPTITLHALGDTLI